LAEKIKKNKRNILGGAAIRPTWLTLDIKIKKKNKSIKIELNIV